MARAVTMCHNSQAAIETRILTRLPTCPPRRSFDARPASSFCRSACYRCIWPLLMLRTIVWRSPDTQRKRRRRDVSEEGARPRPQRDIPLTRREFLSAFATSKLTALSAALRSRRIIGAPMPRLLGRLRGMSIGRNRKNLAQSGRFLAAYRVLGSGRAKVALERCRTPIGSGLGTNDNGSQPNNSDTASM